MVCYSGEKIQQENFINVCPTPDHNASPHHDGVHTSASVAPGLPIAMFSLTVVAKSVGSWLTRPTCTVDQAVGD